MEVTEVGISTEVKPVQPENAALPMEVTEDGISIEVKPVQPENAQASMVVNPVKYCSSSNEVMEVLFLNTVPNSVTAAASV